MGKRHGLAACGVLVFMEMFHGEALQNARAAQSIMHFASGMNPGYEWNWHHHKIAHTLERFFKGELKRVMLFVPPQHGKSIFTSQLFPAWALGKNPDLKIVLASYSASIAEAMNRDAQRYIDSPAYAGIFPGTKLPGRGAGGKYQRTTKRFDIAGRKGYFKCVGVGGSLTGTPADIAIIDDPHKDREAAKSPRQSQKVWEWYTDVLSTRLHNNSGVLLIQTRWDTMDLAGRILQQQQQAAERGDTDTEPWTVICFPAIKENHDNPDDPRQVGEALWPRMHNLARLSQIRATSLRTFQSLYQQNPMPIQTGGECYKNFDLTKNTGQYDPSRPETTGYRYDPEQTLHFSFDFNVNPYTTCTVHQVHSQIVGQKTYNKVYQLEEICLRSPQNTTRAICKHILSKYGTQQQAPCYVYGDPAGNKEDTRSEKGHNDYLIIKKELAPMNPQVRVAPKAPAVATRIEFINSIFSFAVPELEFYIHKNCTNTINDCLYIMEEADGSKQKLKSIDPYTGITCERYGHTSDSFEYMLCTAFTGIYTHHQSGNSGTNIILGRRQSRHT